MDEWVKPFTQSRVGSCPFWGILEDYKFFFETQYLIACLSVLNNLNEICGGYEGIIKDMELKKKEVNCNTRENE